MNVVGGLFGFLIALVFAVPLAVALLFAAPVQSGWALDVGRIAGRLLVGFLLIYAYGVLSAYLHTLVMRLASFVVPRGTGRSVVYWVLAILYLGLTLFALFAWVPLQYGVYHVAANLSASGLGIVTGAYGIAGLTFALLTPVHILLVTAAYVIADSLAPPSTVSTTTPGELLWRGILIGLNAGANLVLGALALATVLEPFLGTDAFVLGLVWGSFCALLTLFASGMPTSSPTVNLFVRVVLGWCSWLLPTNWIAIALGWLLYCINQLGHVLLGLPFHPWAGLFSMNDARIYWTGGTANVEGGVSANLWFPDAVGINGNSAYNLGSFTFIHAPTTYTGAIFPGGPLGIGLTAPFAIALGTLQHEAGHNLNLAAFGSHFHFVGAIDENFWPGRGRRAYSERFAESNVTGTGDPVLPFWRP
jgi:hypothetical protein